MQSQVFGANASGDLHLNRDSSLNSTIPELPNPGGWRRSRRRRPRRTGFSPGASPRSAPATQGSFPIMGYNESRWSSARSLPESHPMAAKENWPVLRLLRAASHPRSPCTCSVKLAFRRPRRSLPRRLGRFVSLGPGISSSVPRTGRRPVLGCDAPTGRVGKRNDGYDTALKGQNRSPQGDALTLDRAHPGVGFCPARSASPGGRSAALCWRW